MIRWLRAPIALAALFLAAACGAADPVAPEGEAGPRFTGGFSVGGNYAEMDSTHTTTSTTSTDGGTLSGDGTSQQDEEDRTGGFSVGGN